MKDKKQSKPGHPFRKKLFPYVSILNVCSFLAIRLSGYNVNSSVSILSSVAMIVKKAVSIHDFLLFDIALLIIVEVFLYLVFIFIKWKLVASISLFALWIFIHLKFTIFFPSNLFLLSSIPFLLFNFLILTWNWTVDRNQPLRIVMCA